MTLVTDTETWDAMLGYTWPERERMIFLRDYRPAMFPGFHDHTDEFDIVDPVVAAALAGPLVELTWHGAPDRPVDVG